MPGTPIKNMFYSASLTQWHWKRRLITELRGERHCFSSSKHSCSFFLLSCWWLLIVNFCDIRSSKKGNKIVPVYERISSDDSGNCLLSTADGPPLCSSSSRFSSPLQNFLNHHYTICSLAVPGPNVLLMLQIVSTALWPILSSKKLLVFAFCLTSFL